MPQIPLVNIGWIHPFLEILEEAGALYDELLRKANLPTLTIDDGSPDISLAAALAGTSMGTLQRRLREQGLTYTQLLEELRPDLALYLLRDPNRSASEISHELGYRDPAIFIRAFRRWTGQTPSKFRTGLIDCT